MKKPVEFYCVYAEISVRIPLPRRRKQENFPLNDDLTTNKLK